MNRQMWKGTLGGVFVFRAISLVCRIVDNAEQDRDKLYFTNAGNAIGTGSA